MIDNEFYKHLGERWYTSEGDAVALLRRENELKAPWVAAKIESVLGAGAHLVLDVGCGGGFLCAHLNRSGLRVTGLDVSETVMAPGRARDVGGQIEWRVGFADALPFENSSFDVICLMDVLEHLEHPAAAVTEALRVLRPGGVFLFHTFNRTFPAWLLAAKGLDWFIRGSQTHVHEWRLFLKPGEVEAWVIEAGGRVEEWRGIRPRVGSALRLLWRRKVPADFEFTLSRSLAVGYLGVARQG